MKGHPIQPGSTIGILGGGQLGRMFAIAARRMGYRIHIFEPQSDSPAGQVSDRQVTADYADVDAVRDFAAKVDVLSFEFENIPLATVEAASGIRPVRPGGQVLHICQNREREKCFLREKGFPCAPFAVVDSPAALEEAIREIGLPAVLKTADFGYDGKGQRKIEGAEDPVVVWKEFGADRGVLEKWISHTAELSVIVARGTDGDLTAFPASENIHTNHILDVSVVPARIPPEVILQAVEIAGAITRELEVVGLLAVEMFLTGSGDLLINELAPRPHNSGHFSFDACVTSQFEQQLRAICALPLGSTELLSPAVMGNLLGDVWSQGDPDWSRVLRHPGAKLHLYGKAQARPGRKMGHITILDSIPNALSTLEMIRRDLRKSGS